MTEKKKTADVQLFRELEVDILTTMLEKTANQTVIGGSRFEKNLQREKVKKYLETIASAIKNRRKAYRSNFDIDRSGVPNWHRITESININTYKEYPLQVADIIYEGLKHPKDEIKSFCLSLLDRYTEKNGVDIYLLIKVLQSDWVDDLTWPLIYKHQNKMGTYREILHPMITTKAGNGRNLKSEAINNIVLDLIKELRPR